MRISTHLVHIVDVICAIHDAIFASFLFVPLLLSSTGWSLFSLSGLLKQSYGALKVLHNISTHFVHAVNELNTQFMTHFWHFSFSIHFFQEVRHISMHLVHMVDVKCPNHDAIFASLIFVSLLWRYGIKLISCLRAFKRKLWAVEVFVNYFGSCLTFLWTSCKNWNVGERKIRKYDAIFSCFM